MNFRIPLSSALAVMVTVSGAQAATVQWEGQSPINIATAELVQSVKPEKLEFHYQRETVVLTNTYNNSGTVPKEWATLKARPVSGPAFQSYVLISGEKYVLAQFHFHAESEHAINGVRSPMEVHLVHLRVHANGEPYCIGEPQSLLVIGALIDQGEASKLLGRIFNGKDLPEDSSQANVTVEAFGLRRLLPKGGSFRYHGSLTAPASVDCTTDVFGHETEIYNATNVNYNSTGTSQLGDSSLGEDGSFPEAVSWVVMEPHITMSHDQIGSFGHLFEEGNSRPVQELKGRVVQHVD